KPSDAKKALPWPAKTPVASGRKQVGGTASVFAGQKNRPEEYGRAQARPLCIRTESPPPHVASKSNASSRRPRVLANAARYLARSPPPRKPHCDILEACVLFSSCWF